MTELERARKHLRSEQKILLDRRLLAAGAPFPQDWEPSVKDAEEGVLAALSWVWEEQEKPESRRRAHIEAYRAANFPHHAFAWTPRDILVSAKHYATRT